MPDDAPSRGPRTDDYVPPSAGDATTRVSDTDPGRTGPYVPGAADPAAPPAVAGYEIAGELGRGGMGVVYRAVHAKLRRPAALKMVLGSARADAKEIIRFLAEAEAVAAVKHPHVVGVYDFGDAGGRPYLALELCPGGSLSDRLKAAGRLDPREAAELLRKVAAGVAAAHAAGVVHRDLKPGNVLFDAAGEPKVSDFGLAKRGGQELTKTNAVMGTPAYMSPEQARGETKFVGPQADVWALGVVLYECLTGRRPFAADDPWALLQQVQSADPAGARTVSREVPRDLDLICRKCLAKEPHERYADAAALADDLGRFLGGQPILARPAGAAERGWKWAKRNKPAVAVILALAGMAGLASWQAVRAGNEADRANGEAGRATTEATNARTAEGEARVSAELARKREGEAKEAEAKAVAREQEERKAKEEEKKARETAEEVSKFMQEVFAQGSAEGQASPDRKVNLSLTVKVAMDHAARSIAGRFEGRPDLEAAIRDTVGTTYRKLAAYPEAEAQLARALALREQALGLDHPSTLSTVNNLALLYRDKRDYTAAEPLLKRALAGHEKARGSDHPYILAIVDNLAALYRDKGDWAAAEPLHKRALAGFEKASGPDDPHTLNSVNSLAALYHTKGDWAAAEPLYQRALAGRQKTRGPDHPSTLSTVNNLALLYQDKGDWAAAEPLYQRALAGNEAAHGPDHPSTLTALNNLALLYQAKGDLVAAEPLLKRALAGYEKALGPDYLDTLVSANNLAGLYQDKGDWAAAEPLYQRVLAGKEKILGPDHPSTLHGTNNLAVLYIYMRRHADAVPLLERAARGFEKRPEMAGAVPFIRGDLGVSLLATGRPAAAEPDLLAGYAGLSNRKTLGRVTRNRLRGVTAALVEVYTSTNQSAKAAEWRAKLAALPPEVAPPPRPAK